MTSGPESPYSRALMRSGLVERDYTVPRGAPPDGSSRRGPPGKTVPGTGLASHGSGVRIRLDPVPQTRSGGARGGTRARPPAFREGLMHDTLKSLGLQDVNSGASTGTWLDTKGPELASINPADGSVIAKVRQATAEDYDVVVRKSQEAFAEWRMVPAPRRGEMVRRLGEELRRHKEALGRLV